MVAAVVFLPIASSGQSGDGHGPTSLLKLPEPKLTGKLSVEEALARRRSVRDYTDKPLTLTEVSQLLWAAQGITDKRGFRTAPSAGALYPLEVYIVAGNVEGLADGIYKYRPAGHELEKVARGDKRLALCAAALGQRCVGNAAAVIVFAADYERTAKKYGRRAPRYVHMEVGHAAENVYLQAVSLGLGTTVVGGFRDEKVKAVVGLAGKERPMCLMPVGRPR